MRTPEYGLDPPQPIGAWPLPGELSLDNGLLAWSPEPVGGPTATSTGPLLEQFLDLRTKRDSSVHAFAKKYGVLGLCLHGLPRLHEVPSYSPRTHDWFLEFRPCGLQTNGDTRYESCKDWRNLANAMKAVLDVAVALRGNSKSHPLGDLRLWQAIPQYGFEFEFQQSAEKQSTRTNAIVAGPVVWVRTWNQVQRDRLPSDQADAWSELMSVVNQWCTWADVHPQLIPGTDGPKIVNVGVGLFGALASQLMGRVTASGSMAICSHCATPYTPKRRPRPDKDNYCPTCQQRNIAQQRASARSRAKQAKLKKELST